MVIPSGSRVLSCRNASPARVKHSLLNLFDTSAASGRKSGGLYGIRGGRSTRVTAMNPAEILTRSGPPPDHTIRYGPGPENVADVRLPSGGGPRGASSGSGKPLVVALHEGFWRVAADRMHAGPMAAALAAEGLSGVRARVPPGRPGWWRLARDFRRRCRGCRPAARPGGGCGPGFLRPERLLLAGHSAGRHLAAGRRGGTCCCRERTQACGSRPKVTGIAALAPVSDLVAGHRPGLGGGSADDLLGGGPEQRPQRYALGRPGTHDSAGSYGTNCARRG
jgi:hypothetical protein